MTLTDSSTEMSPPPPAQPKLPGLYSAASEFRPVRPVWHCATELDARGHPPPKPLDVILATLATTASGDEFYVRTRTRPDDLLEALRQRNISAVSTELPDASWRTRVVPREER